MKKWQAELLGHEFDLMDLPTAFLELPTRVLEEGGHFYLEAGELERLTDHGAVRAAAEKVVARINGAMRLRDSDYNNVRVGPVHELLADGSRSTAQVVAGDAILVRAKAMPITVVGGAPAPPARDPAVGWVETASQDEDVAEALDLWANEPHSWVNLYKVFEIIQSRRGLSLGGVSRKEIDRLTHTANHEQGGGREARHARLGTDPPRNPMSLADADRLVGHLLRAWLVSLS